MTQLYRTLVSTARKVPLVWIGGILVLGSMGGMGCDTSLAIYEDPEKPYSIMGVLDAGVDTQFVRVASLSDSLVSGARPDPFRGTVQTTHLASGRTTTWTDSLTRFEFATGVNERNVRWVHNFWTTANFRSGETYRFSVTSPDGETSAAEVTLPSPLQPPRIFEPSISWHVRFEDLAPLADLKILLRDSLRTGRVVVRHVSLLPDTLWMNLGRELNARIDVTEVRSHVVGTPIDQKLRFVAAGPDWPGKTLLSRQPLVLDSLSNVEGGRGYLAGVTSRTIPLAPTE